MTKKASFTCLNTNKSKPVKIVVATKLKKRERLPVDAGFKRFLQVNDDAPVGHLDVKKLDDTARKSFVSVVTASLNLNVQNRIKDAIKLGAPFVISEQETVTLEAGTLKDLIRRANQAYKVVQSFDLEHDALRGFVWYQSKK